MNTLGFQSPDYTGSYHCCINVRLHWSNLVEKALHRLQQRLSDWIFQSLWASAPGAAALLCSVNTIWSVSSLLRELRVTLGVKMWWNGSAYKKAISLGAVPPSCICHLQGGHSPPVCAAAVTSRGTLAPQQLTSLQRAEVSAWTSLRIT